MEKCSITLKLQQCPSDPYENLVHSKVLRQGGRRTRFPPKLWTSAIISGFNEISLKIAETALFTPSGAPGPSRVRWCGLNPVRRSHCWKWQKLIPWWFSCFSCPRVVFSTKSYVLCEKVGESVQILHFLHFASNRPTHTVFYYFWKSKSWKSYFSVKKSLLVYTLILA